MTEQKMGVVNVGLCREKLTYSLLTPGGDMNTYAQPEPGRIQYLLGNSLESELGILPIY